MGHVIAFALFLISLTTVQAATAQESAVLTFKQQQIVASKNLEKQRERIWKEFESVQKAELEKVRRKDAGAYSWLLDQRNLWSKHPNPAVTSYWKAVDNKYLRSQAADAAAYKVFERRMAAIERNHAATYTCVTRTVPNGSITLNRCGRAD
jgi:hypothetical protein